MNSSNSEIEVISYSSIVKGNTSKTVDTPINTADEPVVPADESVVPADEPVVPAVESVVPADESVETRERKPRYAKSSTQTPINVKVNFKRQNNTRTNPKANNNEFIEKEKAKIERFKNKYTPTIVHKVSYKDFEPQQIGNQSIVFSRKHFIHNQKFFNRIIDTYEKIFPNCDWVNIKDSTRANEPNTLIIIIGKNKN